MKRIVLISTLIFWCGVAGILILGSSGQKQSAKPETPQVAAYSLADIAKHATAEICWMAIHGKVYDLTAYAPRHPSRPEVFLKYCGKEATQGFDTKDRDRPHSSAAERYLEEFFIGVLVNVE
jgi:cytochrome b involved in lipid metabolism